MNELDDILDRRLRDVPLPYRLVERLKSIPRGESDPLDSWLRDVPVPNDLLVRCRALAVENANAAAITPASVRSDTPCVLANVTPTARRVRASETWWRPAILMLFITALHVGSLWALLDSLPARRTTVARRPPIDFTHVAFAETHEFVDGMSLFVPMDIELTDDLAATGASSPLDETRSPKRFQLDDPWRSLGRSSRSKTPPKAAGGATVAAFERDHEFNSGDEESEWLSASTRDWRRMLVTLCSLEDDAVVETEQGTTTESLLGRRFELTPETGLVRIPLELSSTRAADGETWKSIQGGNWPASGSLTPADWITAFAMRPDFVRDANERQEPKESIVRIARLAARREDSPGEPSLWLGAWLTNLDLLAAGEPNPAVKWGFELNGEHVAAWRLHAVCNFGDAALAFLEVWPIKDATGVFGSTTLEIVGPVANVPRKTALELSWLDDQTRPTPLDQTLDEIALIVATAEVAGQVCFPMDARERLIGLERWAELEIGGAGRTEFRAVLRGLRAAADRTVPEPQEFQLRETQPARSG